MPDNPLAPLIESFRSDELPKLAALLRQIRAFPTLNELFRVDLILDANVVLKELIWLTKTRKNPKARSDIMELTDCDTVRVIAPKFLDQEMEVKIPVVAKKCKIPVEPMREHWAQYRQRIQFINVGGPTGTVNTRDVKDTPYLKAQEQTGAPIVTKDKDIEAMGGRAIGIQIFATLKQYSRNAATEYHLKVIGVGSALVIWGLVSALVQGGKALSSQAGKLPKPVLYVGAALLVIAVLHPVSRAKILEILGDLFMASAAILALQMTGIEEHYKAQCSANQALAEVKAHLDPTPSAPQDASAAS